MKTNPVVKAIEAVGSVDVLARSIGVSRQAIYKWVESGMVPPKRVKEVSGITKIPMWELCPKYFPPVVKSQSAANQIQDNQ